MKIRLTGLAWLLSSQIHAFPCYLTVVKDDCWSKYQVDITAVNADNNSQTTTVSIPVGQSWARQVFECQPNETLSFTAVFSPIFWQVDKGRSYEALSNWSLPQKISPGEKAWSITLCYPLQFNGVPLPPDASNHCSCDMTKVTPIKPL